MSTNLARFLDESEARFDKPLKHGAHDIQVLFRLQRLRQCIQPRPEHRVPAEGARFQVDHSTATYCRRLHTHTRARTHTKYTVSKTFSEVYQTILALYSC